MLVNDSMWGKKKTEIGRITMKMRNLPAIPDVAPTALSPTFSIGSDSGTVKRHKK
jgi:hypothetical protein